MFRSESSSSTVAVTEISQVNHALYSLCINLYALSLNIQVAKKLIASRIDVFPLSFNHTNGKMLVREVKSITSGHFIHLKFFISNFKYFIF